MVLVELYVLDKDFREYDRVKDETNLEELGAEPFNDLDDDDIAEFFSWRRWRRFRWLFEWF